SYLIFCTVNLRQMSSPLGSVGFLFFHFVFVLHLSISPRRASRSSLSSSSRSIEYDSISSDSGLCRFIKKGPGKERNKLGKVLETSVLTGKSCCNKRCNRLQQLLKRLQ